MNLSGVYKERYQAFKSFTWRSNKKSVETAQQDIIVEKYSRQSIPERNQVIFTAFRKHIETKKTFQHYASTVDIFRTIYLRWLLHMANSQSLNYLTLENVVLLHGSYFLGIQSHCSDVDLLFLAPPFVKRHDFFHDFFPYLVEELRKQKHTVTGIDVRDSVYVPVLMFFCNSVFYDCQFLNVELKMFDLLTEHHLDMSQISDLHVCNAVSLRSLNSLRALQVMKVTMEKSDKFQLWLSLIRYLNLWMKRKNLCSNSTGFLSSIAIKILAMKICQLFMNVNNELQLLCHFFETFGTLDWHHSIVCLYFEKEEKEEKYKKRRNQLLIQRKEGSGYEEDVMVVCLPTHPKLNTCKNVTLSTLKILVREFNRASSRLHKLLYSPLSNIQLVDNFSRFLDRRGYFTIYNYFLHVSFYNHEVLNRNDLAFSYSAKREKIVGIIKHALKSVLKSMDPYLQCGEIYEKNVQQITRKLTLHEFISLNRLFLGFHWKPSVKWVKRNNLITVTTQLLQRQLEKELNQNKISLNNDLELGVFFSSGHDSLIRSLKRGEKTRIKTKVLRSPLYSGSSSESSSESSTS